LHHRRKPGEFCGLFPLGYPQVSEKLDAVSLLQAFCDEHVLHHFAIWQRQTHPAVLRGSKKLRMSMKVPSTTTLSFPTLSPLLTAGKNIVGSFLDRHSVNVFLVVPTEAGKHT
jgi:hypothetical protein